MQDLQSPESQVQENKRHFFNFSFFKVELPLMENMVLRNSVTKLLKIVSSERELNPRPLPYQGNALPG